MNELELKTINELTSRIAPPTPALEITAAPDGNQQLAVVKEGYRLERILGPTKNAREHTFHDLKSAAEWLNRHADVAEVEILADEAEVVAALTPGDPTGDVVRARMIAHPMLSSWTGIFGKPLNQKALHAQVRGNKAAFRESAPGVSEAEVISGELKKLSVGNTSDLQGELDEMGYYRFQSSTGRVEVSGRIPSSFEIVVPVFIGVEDEHGIECRYPIEILVWMNADGGAVAFTLSAPGLPLIMHQARLDAVAYLRSLLNDGFLVGLGTAKLRTVPKISEQE